MIRVAVSAFLIFASATSAAANCDALKARDADGTAALFAPDQATCQTAQQTGGEVLYCYSEHPFRSEAAIETAQRLESLIAGCFAAVQKSHDVAVNHPDSYASRHFDAENAHITLSVKDKGALGQTLVFLRIVIAAD